MQYRKEFKRIALLTALVVMFAFPTVANAADMVPKIDNFIFFVDQSGSMAQAHGTMGTKKIELAKQTLMRMNAKVPELNYNSALFLFAPFEAKAQPMQYDKGKMDAAIGGISTDFDIFNRLTPMGDGLMDVDPVISGMSGKTALIIFTDGASNIGADPIAQAKALYAKYGDRLCIHVVGFADTAAGQMVIDEIRALSGCTVPADVASLSDDAALAAYVKDVFYKTAAPAPEPQPMEAAVITFDLQFGFDKYQITDEMIPVLEQAKMILEDDSSAAYIIEGHTDWTGTEQYNQGLSERRANSVRQWLIDNGVTSGRLQSIGYGELKPKYDNSTKEGRRLNRRVEIRTK